MTAPHRLDWLPPDSPVDQSIAIHPAADAWDAIRVPAHLARHALVGLGAESGAVICDPREGCYYWLVPVGTARAWDVPHTRACGETQYVAVPSPGHRSRPGLHWIIPPSGDRCITDPGLLRDAILAAAEVELGPRREPTQ